MARSQTGLAAALLLLALVSGAAAANIRTYTNKAEVGAVDLCRPCIDAVTAMDDVLFDPEVEGTLVNFTKDQLCPKLGPAAVPCVNLTSEYIQAFFSYLQEVAVPSNLCTNVCPPPPLATARALLQVKPRVGVPLCTRCTNLFDKLKLMVNNGTKVETILAEGHKFCDSLPLSLPGKCNDYLDTNAPILIEKINTTDAIALCQGLGLCLSGKPAASAALSAAVAKMLPQGEQELNALAEWVQQRQNDMLKDTCGTCKVVIQEARVVIADPKFQASVVDYAKELCQAFPALADTCVAEIDQYSPLIFGAILVYLQPDVVCVELSMCPAPPPEQLLTRALRLGSWQAIQGKVAAVHHVARQF